MNKQEFNNLKINDYVIYNNILYKIIENCEPTRYNKNYFAVSQNKDKHVLKMTVPAMWDKLTDLDKVKFL